MVGGVARDAAGEMIVDAAIADLREGGEDGIPGFFILGAQIDLPKK